MTFPDAPTGEAGTDASGDAVGDGGTCASNADCDDHLPCTMDLCLFGGTCQHTSTCTSAMPYCTMAGCAAMRSCTTDADCDDHIACTHDLCGAGGGCQNLRDDSRCNSTAPTCSVTLGCIAMGRCGVDADCDDGLYCNGAEHCMGASGSTAGTCSAGTPASCDDMDPCTADQCVNATMMCTHTPLMPCGGTVQSGTYTLSPAPQFSCANGSIGPVTTIMMMVTSTSVTVTGFGTTLTGGAPSMGMFSVSGPWTTSGCGGTITLSGSFTMPGYFAGTWSLSAGMCDISCNSFFARTNGTLTP